MCNRKKFYPRSISTGSQVQILARGLEGTARDLLVNNIMKKIQLFCKIFQLVISQICIPFSCYPSCHFLSLTMRSKDRLTVYVETSMLNSSYKNSAISSRYKSSFSSKWSHSTLSMMSSP